MAPTGHRTVRAVLWAAVALALLAGGTSTHTYPGRPAPPRVDSAATAPDHVRWRSFLSLTVPKVHTTHTRKAAPPRKRPSLLLTFDDGPDPQFTPQVLALLESHGVHAVFCLIGRMARAYPAVVRAIVADGHTLCDHTWNHDMHLATRSASVRRVDIAAAARAITVASGGVAPVFFRAPGGNWSRGLEATARAQGLRPLKWTVDPRDWSRPGTRRIVQSVLAQVRPGGVILLHDGGGDRAQTVGALRALLVLLRERGYGFADPARPASP
jgi:peptidoglycan/xylan/chitin deacetylase (PgdA/CDA1 family)